MIGGPSPALHNPDCQEAFVDRHVSLETLARYDQIESCSWTPPPLRPWRPSCSEVDKNREVWPYLDQHYDRIDEAPRMYKHLVVE